MIADGDGAKRADAVAPHGKELEVGAVVAAGGEACGTGFISEPYGGFEFVGSTGRAATEVVAGHSVDISLDVLLADGGEAGRLELGGVASGRLGAGHPGCRKEDGEGGGCEVVLAFHGIKVR